MDVVYVFYVLHLAADAGMLLCNNYEALPAQHHPLAAMIAICIAQRHPVQSSEATAERVDGPSVSQSVGRP